MAGVKELSSSSELNDKDLAKAVKIRLLMLRLEKLEIKSNVYIEHVIVA